MRTRSMEESGCRLWDLWRYMETPGLIRRNIHWHVHQYQNIHHHLPCRNHHECFIHLCLITSTELEVNLGLSPNDWTQFVRLAASTSRKNGQFHALLQRLL